MDLDLFSGIIRKLILVHDRVSLPGMGSFIAETAPSVFSDRAMVIHPPFRRILFRSGEIWNDGILEDTYAREFALDDDAAKKEIAEFVSYLKRELNTHKSLRIPEFGTMRATEQNDYFFVAEKGLFNYLEAFGLEPLNIKILPKKGEVETHTKNAVKNFFGHMPTKGSVTDKTQDEEEELHKEDEAELQGVVEKESHKAVKIESKEVAEKEVVEEEVGEVDDEAAQGAIDAEASEAAREEASEVADNESQSTADKEILKSVETRSQESTEKEPHKVAAKEDESQSTSQEQHIDKEKDNVKEKESRFIKRVIIVLSVVFLILALIVAAVVFKDELRPFWEWLLYSEEEREFLRSM